MALRNVGHHIRRMFKAEQLQPRDRAGTAQETTGAGSVPKGFSSIESCAPEDIFVAGYPKSGNTWVQCLIAGAIYGVDLELAPDALVQDLVPDLHARTVYRRYSTPMFFKTHHLPRPQYRRVVYLLRDGRDVMVSYYHHLEALQANKPDFLRIIQTGDGLFPCKWPDHVTQWLDNPYGSQMIVVRYEDLKANAAAELRRICDFAGVQRAPEIIETAVRKASFGSMQQREKALGWENSGWPKDKPFIRRGAVGSHVDEMPPNVRQAFLDQAASALARAHYLPAAPAESS